MLKKIKVENFRSLDNFKTEFNKGLNVIIGENDVGKTSLIDSLKILFNDKQIDNNDFRNKEKQIKIELETEELIYKFTSKLIEGKPENVYENKPTQKIFNEFFNIIKSEEFTSKSDDEKRNILKKYCSFLNISLRVNSNPETLIKNIEDKMGQSYENSNYIENKQLIYPISFLGSKKFDDMNSFFEDTFFKEFKQDIWDKKFDEITINELINKQIDLFKDKVLSEENTKELYDILSVFLPNFKEIKLETYPDPKITLNIDVNFLNTDGQEISLEKMGDGTNRRTTIALFRYKQDKNDLCYVFDEPDTHLHIKAQLDILNLFKVLTSSNKQLIITTHSPFLINEVSTNDIKFMKLDEDNKSTIFSLTEDVSSQFLKDLGISNIDLFFTDKLLLVEGVSEEIFIPIFFKKIYDYPINHKFIKIVKAEGIKDIPNFVRVIKDTFPDTNIFVLMDNDASDKDESKLDNLLRKYDGISQENIFRLGNQEFEDSFSNEILVKSINYYLKRKLTVDEEIDVKEIEDIRKKSGKFSANLNNLLLKQFGIELKKPDLAEILASHSKLEDVDETLLNLFKTLLK